MTIQEFLLKAWQDLSESFKNYKAAQDTLKDMKKELKSDLKKDDKWSKCENQIRLLKNNRKEIWEQIKELQKQQDQIALELDQYKAIQDFVVEMEDKYSDNKDKVLNRLSRELAEKWVIAEIEYRNWKLILIVAKH